MEFKLNDSDSIKSKISILAICAIIFILLAIPFHYFFPIFQVSELRPASALPPVFGMMFGPWGAFGVAIGNLIADIIAGRPPKVFLIGFIAQFLYAYIPYKLWYTLRINKDSTKPRINNVENLVKFVIIILISATLMSILLGTFLEALNINNISSSTTLIFEFNNFDFSMILGILIITLANFYNIKMYKPKKAKKIYISPMIFDLILMLSIAIGVIYIIYSLIFAPSQYIVIITLLIYLMAFSYIFKPITKEVKEKKSLVKISLTEKIISFFIIIGAIIAILTGIIAFYTSPIPITHIANFWEMIFITITLILGLFYILSIIFLWYIEKAITTPIESIAHITEEYTSNDENIENTSFIISKIREYTNKNDEIKILAYSLEKMIINLKKYMNNLKKVTAEKERINTELDIAEKIQSSMLPNEFPAFPNNPEIDIYAMSKPAKEVGGDFYDFFLIDKNHLAIVIADVSGKGIPAALFMVIAKTLIKNEAHTNNTLGKMFENVNNQLSDNNKQNMFVTAWMGILEIDTGKFTFVNAGHNPPILKKDNNYSWLKSKPNFVLGGMENMIYNQKEIFLQPGDRLLLYTDGVTEAINKNEEAFGEGHLLNIINESGDFDIYKVLDSVKSEINHFVGDSEQFDDITMVILEYKK